MTGVQPARGAAQGRLHLLALGLVAGALALGGCGDDETTTDTGTSSTTGNTPTGQTTTDTSTAGETTTGSTSGSGGTGYSAGGGYDPEDDTEDNDIEPPEGSEADEFEQACEDNPGAC